MDGLSLSSHQRCELQHQLRTTDKAALCRRILAILEVDAGKSISGVAELLGVSRQSIYNWIQSYQSWRHPEALADRQRSGRPLRWTDEIRIVLQECLKWPPDRWGCQAVSWTVPLLQNWLAEQTGVRFSESSIREHLHHLGYTWKRSRYVLEPDPEREKKNEIRRRIQRFSPRTMLLFEDETDLLLFPPLRSGWAKRGEPFTVTLSGGNAKRVVFGAINPHTGHRLFLPQRRGRSAEFQEFLHVIHRHYRAWPVALLLDEGPSHTAKHSQRIAAELEIQLLWLPKRSPELNPLEGLWGDGKDHVCANRQYATIEEEVNQFVGYLNNLSPHDTLNKAGVLSKDFWLNQ